MSQNTEELKKYFKEKKGVGVLSTSDSNGNIDSVVYPLRPFIMDDGTFLFLMEDDLFHANLLSNPKAIYIFFEDFSHHKGKKLYLTKVREEVEIDMLCSFGKQKVKTKEGKKRFRVFFKLEKEVPLLPKG